MELKPTTANLPETPPRDIDTVTGEIITICKQAQTMALMYAIEIGRRLKEAKSLLPHGEWGNWLKERVEFSPSSAQNFMKIFDEYGTEQISLFGDKANTQTLGNLPYTKALRLLSLPAEEREEFVQEHNVEKMSSRDLEKALKERDEANRRAQLAEEKASAAEQAEERVEKEKAKVAAADTEIYRLQPQLEPAQADLIKAKEAEKKAKEKAKELKENPVIAQDVLERMQAESDAKAKAEATAEMEDAVAEANERIIAAITAKESAERVAKEAIERAEMLRRQIEMSNPDIIEFKTVFREVQQNVARLQEIKARVQTTDPESASKLAAALHAFLVSQQEGR